MTTALRELRHVLRNSPIFAFYLLVTVGLAGFIGLMFAQMAWGRDFYLPGAFGQMTHGAVGSHRVHDLTFGVLITTGIIGVLAQLQRPAENVASIVMALIPFGGLALAALLSDSGIIERNPLYLVAAVTAVAALLHPSERTFFRSFSVARINWLMLALVGIAAVPLLRIASTNLELQEVAPDDHAILGHYAFMAAFGFTVIGVGLLASLRADGWRPTAWVTGLFPALVGLTSLIYPDASSNLDSMWALAAVAWGAVFIAVAELTQDAEHLTLSGLRGVAPKSTRG